jgi:hypothetical protein
MAALSQLSYGPKTLQFSREIEVFSPIQATPLIVSGWAQAKLDLGAPAELSEREVETAVELDAISSERIYLAVLVHTA